MKNTICFACVACILAGFAVSALKGTEPPQLAVKGHVLLLDNGRIIEGKIERDKDRYHVCRDLSECWVPADRATYLCDSLDQCYRYLRDRANLGDLDERLRLAEWCRLHDLPTQGATEAQAALELRPGCPAAVRLLRCFHHEETPPAAVVPKKSEPAVSTDLSLEAASLFTAKVQPILMNTCISCHGSVRGGAFRLVPTFEDGGADSHATQLNLVAAVAQVNRGNWQASPLLVKAVNIHGTASQPPLKGRQLSAFETLEDWAQKVAASAPAVAAAPTPSPANEVMPASPPSQPRKDSEIFSGVAGSAAPSPTPPKEKEGSETEAREVPHLESKLPPPPKPPAEPVDAFDPLIFNREAHPEQPAQPDKP